MLVYNALHPEQRPGIPSRRLKNSRNTNNNKYLFQKFYNTIIQYNSRQKLLQFSFLAYNYIEILEFSTTDCSDITRCSRDNINGTGIGPLMFLRIIYKSQKSEVI